MLTLEDLLILNTSTIFLFSIVSYFLFIIICYFVALRTCSQKFSDDNAVPVDFRSFDALNISFMDCSAVYVCFPCRGISLREWMNHLCTFDWSRLRQFATCECIRPTFHGSASNPTVDFVCCGV